MTPNVPEYHGRPIYGYDASTVQHFYTFRQAESVAKFFLHYLKSGTTLLDCGCGPGTITLDLAELVAPAKVVGIDIEPGMVDQAKVLAEERKINNIEFRVADILKLPFADDSFDRVFTSAVLEHLSEPTQALEELCRVVKPTGLVGVTSTDWGDPLISPTDESVSRFFELFERGFNRYGGSLNRGRHVRGLMRNAGLEVFEFAAQYANAADPGSVTALTEGFIGWMENLPLFQQAIELGWVDEQELVDIIGGMRKWAQHPDAFISIGRTEALARK